MKVFICGTVDKRLKKKYYEGVDKIAKNLVENGDGKELIEIKRAGLGVFGCKRDEKRFQICHRRTDERIFALKDLFNEIFLSADLGRTHGNAVTRKRRQASFAERTLRAASEYLALFGANGIQAANTADDDAFYIVRHKNLIPIPPFKKVFTPSKARKNRLACGTS